LNFEQGTLRSIRSISQYGLAAAWARLAKDGLPSFEQFDPGPRVHDPKQLAIWKVETSDGQNIFRALYRGSLLDEAFNDGWIGKTLAEVTPPSLASVIISASDHCASTGCAVYTVLRTCDDAGFPIDLERLLLPFGKDDRVELILASLQLISLQGTVERRKVVGNFKAQAECVLSLGIAAAGFTEFRSTAI
jgi:hypothetical protein